VDLDVSELENVKADTSGQLSQMTDQAFKTEQFVPQAQQIIETIIAEFGFMARI
jgi:hypothetical protein